MPESILPEESILPPTLGVMLIRLVTRHVMPGAWANELQLFLHIAGWILLMPYTM